MPIDEIDMNVMHISFTVNDCYVAELCVCRCSNGYDYNIVMCHFTRNYIVSAAGKTNGWGGARVRLLYTSPSINMVYWQTCRKTFCAYIFAWLSKPLFISSAWWYLNGLSRQQKKRGDVMPMERERINRSEWNNGLIQWCIGVVSLRLLAISGEQRCLV